jgi:5-methylcytosine-specific restriction enzyme subunit McrC
VTAPKIPIENVYFLFCYAWNRFEEAQAIGTGGGESPDLPNLLAKVLLSATDNLFRRGLDRGYQPIAEEIGTVRGCIELNGTVALRARHAPRLECQFDELNHDVLHNRILKASLQRLARSPTLDKDLAHELRLTRYRLSDVADMRLTKSDFTRVRLHRNNAYYDLILKVAELAYDCMLPEPDGQGFRFVDVLREERKMAAVFESFVRNFYRVEQRAFQVQPMQIAWDAVVVSAGPEDRLPAMRTDIYLRGAQRHIIIDTKYYAEALQQHHGAESFRSGHLYQLFAYLKNAAVDPKLKDLEGLLLYPSVGKTIDAHYTVQGHSVRLATIDLSRPWRELSQALLSLIARLEGISSGPA